MTNYYIQKDGKIVLFDTDKTRLENTLSFMPQYAGLPIRQTSRPIENFAFADTEEFLAAKAKQQAAEQLLNAEEETGLTRVVRELVLAENSGVSSYMKTKAQEMEQLAAPLRE